MKEHRSSTVQHTMRWQWFDYILLGVIALGAFLSDWKNFTWLWPLVFIIYVWGNVRNVRSAYVEGYSHGLIDGMVQTKLTYDNHRKPPDDN